MPSLDLISAAQSINDSITEKYSVAKANDKIAALIEEEIRVWRSNVRGEIRRNFPFWEEESKLSAWREKIPFEGLNEQLPAFLDDYSRFCSLIGHPFNKHFWGKELQQILQPKKSNKTVNKNSAVTCMLLLNEWQKTLDQTRSEWELRLIEEQRLALLKKLEQLLDLLQELDEQLQLLGLDTGLLIDFSAGRLNDQDISQLKRLMTYMAQDPGVRQLCNLLGKMRQFEASARLEKATVSCSY
ncbi:MAG: hypothetical protein Q7L07_14960, partial [Pseudohongiella sp.]|nr:hypothetical protein [Pseudohongiella sp.]